MQVSVFYLPSIGSRSEIEEGMAGLRGDLYQRMLDELREQAQLADELGYDSISFTEHHFHVEGFELSNNPIMLDLFVALHTKRIRVGQLGIVLPAQNPLRVAEDIAMLDHMSGGRANAGFARGYQRRWVDVMAQQLHGIHGATPGEHDEIDKANREAFEEHFRIIKRAWAQDMLEFHGKYYDFPPVRCLPRPAQRPHPPVLLGGVAPNVLKRVVAYGEGWAPERITAEELKERLKELWELARQAGRDPADLQISIHGKEADPDLVSSYLEAGAQRVVVGCPIVTQEREALEHLERIAKTILPLAERH